MSTFDLFKSAWENDVDGVRAALAAGSDPNEPHPRAGTLPLQLACDSNALESIDVLLHAGARADVIFSPVSRVAGGTFANRTLLMYAQSVEAARRLLDAGAGARLETADDNGWTPLVWAAYRGNLALAAFLLDQGASASARPWFAGERRTLCDLLEVAAEPPPGAHETAAGKERRSQLASVRALLMSRTGEGPRPAESERRRRGSVTRPDRAIRPSRCRTALH